MIFFFYECRFKVLCGWGIIDILWDIWSERVEKWDFFRLVWGDIEEEDCEYILCVIYYMIKSVI